VLDRVANVDLLAAEIDVIWGPGRRPHEAPPSVVIGDAGKPMIIQVRNDVDPSVVDELRTAAASGSRLPGLARTVQEILQQAIGPLEATVGPSYDCSAPADQPAPHRGRLIRSDDPGPTHLPTPPTWDAEEWTELLTGGLGPWAAVVDGDRVLSLCHSARFAPAGVEAGTWTAPEARGLGLAAAATAAWADCCAELPGHVFYSTDALNLSSQRVAARLKLPPIGQLWKFRPADEGDGPRDATLSVLHRVG
jgi:RimJ/RimL family protein N-acetyltransferase